MTSAPEKKQPPLRSAAMIASIADPGMRTTKAPFGEALVAAAEQDERIVGLSADLSKYTDLHIFAQAYPERFYQMGMSEQALMMAAAGMAQTGLQRQGAALRKACQDDARGGNAVRLFTRDQRFDLQLRLAQA